MYVESLTKVDSFFPFFKRVYSFFWIFLNWIADFALWTIVFRLFFIGTVCYLSVYVVFLFYGVIM